MRAQRPPSQPEPCIRVAWEEPGPADLRRKRLHRGRSSTRPPMATRIVIRSPRQARGPGAGKRSRTPSVAPTRQARWSCGARRLRAPAAKFSTGGPSRTSSRDSSLGRGIAAVLGERCHDSTIPHGFEPGVAARGNVRTGARVRGRPVANGIATHDRSGGRRGRNLGAHVGRQTDPARGPTGLQHAHGAARVVRQPGIAAGSPAADRRGGTGTGVRQPQGPESPDGSLRCQVAASRYGQATVPVASTRRIDVMARMSSTVVAVPVGSTTTRSATRVVLARTRPACG